MFVSNFAQIVYKADEDVNDRDDDDNSISSIATLTWDGSNNAALLEITHAKVPVSAPEPRIVVHHHFPFFDKSSSRHTMSNDPLLKLLRQRKYFDDEREMKRKIEADFASSRKVR
jgi:hypothetical protein